MLVLSRKSGEGIEIGDDVVVSVIEIRGSKVRIGIDAPKATRIDRSEIAALRKMAAAAVDDEKAAA